MWRGSLDKLEQHLAETANKGKRKS
jgi:hypothetical protein